MLVPRAGECIGDFELIRRIGAGGMGVVYEARQLSTGRRVALKILSPAMTREKNRLRFLREAEAAARLNHPNIVGVHAIRQDADLCYYAMEFIDGWPLSRVRELLGSAGPTRLPLPEFMRTHADPTSEADSQAATVVEQPGDPAAHQSEASRAGLDLPSPLRQVKTCPTDSGLRTQDSSADTHQPSLITHQPVGSSVLGDASYVRQVVVMLRDIARALHYAHSQGVTHRDVKPENLLLDNAGKLHLVDFGLAHVMEHDNITLTGELMGTPLYMSPEQVAAGRIGIDHRTDLYSLGVVMYHLLCLQPPYEAPTREGLLRAIMVHPPRPLSSRNPAVSRELEAIVHHALEKDPDRRYSSGEEFADDLDRWLAGKPISLRLPGPLGRWWKGISRPGRRALIGGSAVALVLTAGLIGLALRNIHLAPKPPGPAQAIQSAQQEAATGDYFESALWYAEALRRGATEKDVSSLELSMVYNQLPPLKQRFALGPGERPWSLHPTEALCAWLSPEGRMRTCNLGAEADSGLSAPFGAGRSPRWLSFDAPGKHLWSIEPQEGGDALELWTPAGEPVLPEPLNLSGRIICLRAIPTEDGYTVAALLKPASKAPQTARARPASPNLQVYQLQPGQPPVLALQRADIQLVELSYDGKYMATLGGDEVLRIGSVSQTGLRTTVGSAGTTALFASSPTTRDLALADSAGQITLTKIEPGGRSRPIGLALENATLREKTAPAYMRFSPDGKYLLEVGTDSQFTPPYLRSISVGDIRSTGSLYQPDTFGRDAFFADDSQTFVWWNDEVVTFVACSEGQAAERSQIAVHVRGRTKVPESLPDTNFTRHDPLPVQTDRQARRMICIEAAGSAPQAGAASRATAWDTQTGERLGLLLSNAELTACDMDASGRYGLAQVGTRSPELFAWDLADPEARYPLSARLPAQPVSVDDLRLTRRALVATLGQAVGRAEAEWSLIDPATLRQVGSSIPVVGTVSRWLINDQASVLLQVMAGNLLAYDLAGGAPVGGIVLPNDAESVSTMSPDGQWVAIVTSNREVVLHDLSAASAPVRLGPLGERPAHARFSPAGRHIAVAGQSGRISVFSLNPATRIVELETGQPVHQMEFCFDDQMVVAAHAAGRASLWSIPDGRQVAVTAPTSKAGQGEDYSPAVLPTRIAVRDQAVGAAPPLLATAFANRIDVWPLPRPSTQTNQVAPLRPAGPPLQTTYGIVAMAFPPCQTGADGTAGADTAASSPANANSSTTTRTSAGDNPLPCERLLVITDRAGVRWFDLSARSWTPRQWQEYIAARTGMQLGPGDKPVLSPK